MPGHRLKREELVEVVFAQLWAATPAGNRQSIAGVSLDMNDLRDDSSRLAGVQCQNNKWIATQLRSYEKAQGV